MLRQQINLYRQFEEEPIAPSLLSWQRFWLLNFLLLSIFIFIYLYSLSDFYLLKRKKDGLAIEVKLAKAHFEQLKKTYPEFIFSQDAKKTLKQLEQEMQIQEKILSTIVNHIPFSQELILFAKTITPNVWLTDITLTNDGNEINLKGKSIGMDPLQAFLNNLLREKLIANYALIVKYIQNASKNDINGNISFELGLTKKST